MSFEQGDRRVGPLDLHLRPQPEHRVNLSVAVVDPQALWTAAAARLLAAPGMTLEDAIDVIGPCEDPSIAECIATLAKPAALPGCIMDDFWIDSLRGAPPRIDVADASIDHKLASPGRARRPLSAGRAGPRLALCMLPATLDVPQPN